MPRKDLGLPIREFMYTLDQIAFLLDIDEAKLRRTMIHFNGRTVGVCDKDRMLAIDISPDDAAKPEWRVSERHLRAWMRFKGWRVYERSKIQI